MDQSEPKKLHCCLGENDDDVWKNIMAATCFQRTKLMDWSCQCLFKIDGVVVVPGSVGEILLLDDGEVESE